MVTSAAKRPHGPASVTLVLVGLWVLVVVLGAVAVLKNIDDGSTPPTRANASAAARSASTAAPRSASTSVPALGPDPTLGPMVTVQSENDVLDRLNGVAPPGATRWDDFHVFNQGPGVDVAAAEAVDGSGAIAFYAFSSDSEAQGFVRDPPPHLAGIGDYNALQALPPSAGLPAGASVADLRTCSGSATGVATGTGVAACTGSTHSSGVITVVPLGNFALVTAAWSTTPGEASGETTDRAVREAGEALTFWAGTPK